MMSLPRLRVNRGDGGDAGSPQASDATPHRGAQVHARADANVSLPRRDRPAPQDETELARRLAAGDVSAIDAITNWLWEPLAAYAFRIVDDQDVAMDIAQEACVRLWEGRGGTPPAALRPYLYRVTRNLALDYLKTRRTRSRLLDRQHGRTRRPTMPDEVLEHARVSARVQRAIQELPERRREVFALTYLRGLSYTEAGEVMGISPKTVQNQMTAALAQLRKALQPLIDERSEHRAKGRSDDAR